MQATIEKFSCRRRFGWAVADDIRFFVHGDHFDPPVEFLAPGTLIEFDEPKQTARGYRAHRPRVIGPCEVRFVRGVRGRVTRVNESRGFLFVALDRASLRRVQDEAGPGIPKPNYWNFLHVSETDLTRGEMPNLGDTVDADAVFTMSDRHWWLVCATFPDRLGVADFERRDDDYYDDEEPDDDDS